MALKVNGLDGNELAVDYTRKSLPKGRWADAWDVFKSNFLKLVLLNVFVLISFVPGIAVVWFRNHYISGLGTIYPFNGSITFPFYTNTVGLTESVNLSSDILFYSLLIVAGFIAAIGISGAAYSIRKMLHTHGEFTIKTFFRGIKTCYFSTLLPLEIFLIFMVCTLLVGDWRALIFAMGGNRAAAVTAQVFITIATVLVGLFCGWLFAVGTGYRCTFGQLFKNAFVLIVGTPLQTILMAGFTLIPVWFFIIGGFMRTISYILFIFLGFSFILLSWTAYTSWVFDMFVTPNIKPAEKKPAKNGAQISPVAEESKEDIKRLMVAAGKSELFARPMLPVTDEMKLIKPTLTFTRADIAEADSNREKLRGEVRDYEKQHINDPEYSEYNRMFAEREKALPSDGKNGKGKKVKKISSDNLLK